MAFYLLFLFPKNLLAHTTMALAHHPKPVLPRGLLVPIPDQVSLIQTPPNILLGHPPKPYSKSLPYPVNGPLSLSVPVFFLITTFLGEILPYMRKQGIIWPRSWQSSPRSCVLYTIVYGGKTGSSHKMHWTYKKWFTLLL